MEACYSSDSKIGSFCREKGDRGDESLMKLVESNLDLDFVSEKESDPIGVSYQVNCFSF